MKGWTRRMLSVNGRRSRVKVTGCDFVIPVQILKRCAIVFSCFVKILAQGTGGHVLQGSRAQEWDREYSGVTLWSLKTYRSNCSKTKSYRIQRGFLLLFIFLNYQAVPSSCLQAYPQVPLGGSCHRASP